MANYLYNGVELPELPEWDKTTYPYAIICTTNNGNRTYLKATKTPRTYSTNATWLLTVKPVLQFLLSDGAWGEPDLDGYYWENESEDNAIWTNYDIINSVDGSVYLAASEPMPVGFAIIPCADYKATCDVIRAKTGKTDLIMSGDMASEIESIPTYITVATEEEATDIATIPIVEGQVIVVTGA